MQALEGDFSEKAVHISVFAASCLYSLSLYVS